MKKSNKVRPLYAAGDTLRISGVEPFSDTIDKVARSPFRRDYARLLHSAAFRRLQGKTQLFPSTESDFFRNRLTHSLEVAQIARGLAQRINASHGYFQQHPINADLVETASLAHDLGHPPFGHNGEEVLNEWMSDAGGFEGNAQTLRILARVEKRATLKGPAEAIGDDGVDQRLGLDLCIRTLAAVLKYDSPIPVDTRTAAPRRVEVTKGYYATEGPLVARIKQEIAGGIATGFKTIECQIMDLADDIAYSTYDLEDAFKAGFLTPIKLLTLVRSNAGGLAEKVVKAVAAIVPGFTVERLIAQLDALFEPLYKGAFDSYNNSMVDNIVRVQLASDAQAFDGYARTDFTSKLVNMAIQGVELADFNEQTPALSTIRMAADRLQQVEVLKRLTYELIIRSPTIAVVNMRGREIVSTIFEKLSQDGGHSLLPDDHRWLHARIDQTVSDSAQRRIQQKRLICDFVSGMTDRYAVEFYGRLMSERPETIFKPL